MTKKKKRYSAEQKVIILKRHLVDRIAVSDLCDEYYISPTIFYRWQKQFFEKGAIALETNYKNKEAKKDRHIKELTQKIQNKNEVVSELMEAHLRLKKSLGEI
jgi:transposase-like protein